MKKVFLVATLAVAGLVSAKSTVVKNTAPKKEIIKTIAYGCVPVSYSCGVKGWACGTTLMEMLQNAWDGDSLFCG